VRSPETAQERAVGAGGSRDLGRGGLEAEVVAASGVDPAEERIDHPLERLAAEAPTDEVADRLVALRSIGRQHEVESGAQDAERPDEAGAHERHRPTGQAGEDPGRQRAELASGEQERPALARRNKLVLDSDLAGEFCRPRHANEQRVGAEIDGPAQPGGRGHLRR